MIFNETIYRVYINTNSKTTNLIIEATRILTLTISSINKPTDLSIITSEIKNKFYLMGNYLTITLKAFSDALKIINRNYN